MARAIGLGMMVRDRFQALWTVVYMCNILLSSRGSTQHNEAVW
jgi:hypothetical protein